MLNFLLMLFWQQFALPQNLTPDITDKTLILALAQLSSNAYFDNSNQKNWYNNSLFNYEYSYGWDVDGLKGHIFKMNTENIIVISVKGTSLSSSKDKESANLICSCNCCNSNCTNQCDKEKLQNSLPGMYASLLIKVYKQVSQLYPGYTVWFTGHSMGAVVASIVATQTCNSAVTFSSPGEQLFDDRINLVHRCLQKKSNHKITIHHFGYYNDPIFTGTCTLCRLVGYHMDSICHHGSKCTFQKPNDNFIEPEIDIFGSFILPSHRISFLINIIEKTNIMPECIPVTNCTEKCQI